MSYDRRKFLKTTTAGIAMSALTSDILACKSASIAGKIGLQLYTLRDVIPNDPKGVLKQVAAMGYNEIESFEGKTGMFWGMSNTEFKKYMDDLGMKIVSSHCDIDKDFERKANEAAEIGMKYLICPHLGRQKTLDDYKKAAEKFNNRGEASKKAGLKFAYHNHDYSFELQDGQFPQDILMQNTDKELVDFEMDIYWVVRQVKIRLNGLKNIQTGFG
jgi:sugar phosphate isomerase/epimerase